MKTRELHPIFCAEVEDIDLTGPPAADEIEAVRKAMDKYAVLVFRGQPITNEQQLAFSERFGTLEITVRRVNASDPRR